MAGIEYPITYLTKESQENLKKLVKSVAESEKATAKLLKEVEKLKKANEDENKEKSDLIKAQERLAKARTEEARQILKIRADINRLNKETRDRIKLTQAEEIINKKQVKTIKDLEDRTNALTRVRKNLDLTTKEGTKRYRELTNEIRANNAELIKQEAAIGRASRNVGNYAQALTSAASKIAVFAGGILALKRTLDGTVDILGRTSDSLTDIQKTTGLSADAVNNLFEELKQLDTRTSLQGLTEIATAAGRLGLQEDQIVGFVRVVDQSFLALGDSLQGTAEEISLDLAKIADVLGVEDQFGIEEGISRVGSTINELGQNTKATEGFIVDFLKRLQGVAGLAGITAADIAGLGATLDSAGITAEVSSTAISKLLVSLGEDLPAFARVAGISLQEFSRIAETDANEALIKVLEGARSTSGGIVGLAETLQTLGVDAQRAASVAGALVNNIDDLRANQELANKAFQENISLSREADLRNQNLAASIEKLRKEFEKIVADPAFIELIQSLVEGFRTLVQVINPAIKSLGNFGRSVSETFTDALRTSTVGAKFLRSVFATFSDAERQLIESEKLLEQTTKKFGDSLKELSITDQVKNNVRSGLDFVTKAYEDFKDIAVDAFSVIQSEAETKDLFPDVDFDDDAIRTLQELIQLREINNQRIREGSENLIKFSNVEKQRLQQFDREQALTEKRIQEEIKANQKIEQERIKSFNQRLQDVRDFNEQEEELRQQQADEAERILDDLLLTENEKFEIAQAVKEQILRSSLKKQLEDKALSDEEKIRLTKETNAAIEALDKQTSDKLEAETKSRNARIAQAIGAGLGQVAGILISNQEDTAKAIGQAVINTLKNILNAWVATEILKAQAAAPLSFGATLAAIAPIAAVGAAGNAILNGLAANFAEGGYTGKKKNRLIMVNDDSQNREEFVINGVSTQYLGSNFLQRANNVKSASEAQSFKESYSSIAPSTPSSNAGQFANGGLATSGVTIDQTSVLNGLNDLSRTFGSGISGVNNGINSMLSMIESIPPENIAVMNIKGKSRLASRNK